MREKLWGDYRRINEDGPLSLPPVECHFLGRDRKLKEIVQRIKSRLSKQGRPASLIFDYLASLRFLD